MLVGELGRDPVELRLGRLELQAGLQPSHHLPEGVSAVVRLPSGEHLGRPHLPPRRDREAGRHDADNRGGLVVEHQHSTHDLRIAPEPALPEPVAQDDHRRAAREMILGQEGAAQEGGDTQDVEEPFRDEPGVEPLGALGPEMVQPIGLDRRQGFE